MNRPDTPTTIPEPYANEPMTRERAYDVAIAFGLAMMAAGARCPIQPKSAGAGFNAVVPMEFIEGLPALKPWLAPRPPAPKPLPEPPPYEPSSSEFD